MPKAHKFQHDSYKEFVVKKARRYHKCNECRKDIVPREEYYTDTFSHEHNLHRAGEKEYRPKTRKDFELEDD